MTPEPPSAPSRTQPQDTKLSQVGWNDSTSARGSAGRCRTSSASRRQGCAEPADAGYRVDACLGQAQITEAEVGGQVRLSMRRKHEPGLVTLTIRSSPHGMELRERR